MLMTIKNDKEWGETIALADFNCVDNFNSMFSNLPEPEQSFSEWRCRCKDSERVADTVGTDYVEAVIENNWKGTDN